MRNSSLVEWLGAEDSTGLKFTPKLRQSNDWVGERSMWGEVRAEALVDCMEVRMPDK